MADESGDGKCPTGIEIEAGDSPGEEGQLCSVALKDIFLSCDKNNVGSAHAQDLIEFVTPFLSNNKTELLCLKNCLDPDNGNPLITEKQFFDKMQIWISKIKTMSISPEKKGPFDSVSFHQFSSTENGSCGQFFKSSAESAILNLSTTSSTSLGNALQEIVSLQETTRELEFQNRKLQEELFLIKSQLAASEEQNELLQSDVRALNNKLIAEQHLNEQLQAERKENEELRECSQGLTRKIELLEKSFSCVERENGNIKQKLELLEQENQKLEDKLEQSRTRELEKEKSIIKLRTEYDFKEAVIASLEKAVLDMQEKLKDNQQIIEHHIEINEGLKVEKNTLEKFLREQLSQTYTIPSIPPNPLASSSSGTNINNTLNTSHQTHQWNRFSYLIHSDSPIAEFIKHEAKVFNSPKLRGMLENPVSPNLSKTAGQLNESLKSNVSTSTKKEVVEENDAVKTDQTHFHSDTALFKKYRLVGEPKPAFTSPRPQNSHLDKLRQPKCKDAELKAASGDTPVKNNSTSSIFLHDISSEDELFSKVPITESSLATQHSLLYELSQVNKENEVNNNSKNIIDQMQQENDDLKKRLDICSEELEALKKELEFIKQNEIETSKENVNLRNEVKLLIKEKLDLKSISENSSPYIHELEGKLKSSIKLKEKLAKEIEEQKTIVSQTISNSEERNKNLLAELNKLKHELQLKECATENLEHEHLNLLDLLDEFRKEHDELKKKLSDKEIHVQSFTDKLLDNVKEKENHIELLKTEMNILKNKLKENSEENRNSLLEEITELKTSIDSKEESIRELKRLIHNLSVQLDEGNIMREQTQEIQSKKICECNKLIEEKETVIKRLENAIESLKVQINEFETNKEVNDELIKQLRKEIHQEREIQLALEKQKDRNEENLKTEINKLKKFLEDNEKSITYLTTYSNQLNLQISIKEDIEMMLRREINKLEQVLNEKENEISQIKKFVSVKDVRIDELKNYNNKITAELEGVIKEKDENKAIFETKIEYFNKLSEEKDLQINSLNVQIEDFRMTIENNNQSLRELGDFNEHLKESILLEMEKEAELENKIGDLIIAVKNKDDIVEKFQVLINDLQTKLNDANDSLEETEKFHETDVLQLKTDVENKELPIKDVELLFKNLQDHLNELIDTKKKFEEQERSSQQLEISNNYLNEKILLEGKKISELEDELNILKRDIIIKEEKDRKFKLDIDLLKSELDQKDKLIQELEDNDQNLTSKLELTRKVLHEKEDHIQQLNSMNGNLMEQVSEINNSMNIFKNHNKQLKAQLVEKEYVINSFKCSVDALNAEKETNEGIFKAQIKLLHEKLEKKENKTEKLKKELITKVKSLKDESHSLNNVLKLQKTSLENYEVQVCEMNKSLEIKNSQIDTLSHQISQLKESSKEQGVTFAYLQKEFKELENRYQQKITDIEELTTLLIAKEKHIEELKEKNHQFQVTHKKNEDIIIRLETEMAQLNEQLTTLHSDRQDPKSPKSGKCSYDRLNIKIEKLQQKIDSLEHQLAVEKKNSERLVNENSELNHKNYELNETYFELKRELQRLKNENKDDTLETPDSPSGNVTDLALQQNIYERTTHAVANSTENEVDQNFSEIMRSLQNVIPLLSVYREKSPAEKTTVREKFETLVLALTVDASTIIDRVERQKGCLLAMEDSVAIEVAKLLDLLDELQGQNQNPLVANRIVLCIEQVGIVTDIASKTVTTAMKAGSLQQEQNFIQSMCTLINYVSDVQRDLDNVSCQLDVSSKRKKKQTYMSIKSEPRNMFKEIEDVLTFDERNKDYNGTENANTYAPNKGQSSFGRFLFQKCHRIFRSNVFGIFYRLCASIIFIYVMTMILVTCLNNEDLCSPYIKINDGDGPRPI